MRHVRLLLLTLAASCVAQARPVPSRKTPQMAAHSKRKALDQALLQAAQNGDLTALRAALKHGANINARSKNGQTPLMLTVRQGNISLVKLMLDKEAKVNLQDQNGRTALSHVAAQNFTIIVKLLQSHGARANEGDSALLLGEALMGDPAQIKRLLSIGVDREIRDGDGRTAVSILALYGAKDEFPQEEPQRAYALKLLLDGGANPDAADNEGMTALMWAAYTGRISMARLLLAAGAKPDARDNMGQTALHSAAQNTAEAEGLAVAAVLLAKGANVNAADHYGGTTLMIAAKDGRLSLLRLLLNNRANVNAADVRGMTPLMEAAAFGGAPIVEELIRRGADVNAKDKSGKTVLQMLRAAPLEYNSAANFSQEVLKEQLKKAQAQAQARRDAARVLLLKAGAKE